MAATARFESDTASVTAARHWARGLLEGSAPAAQVHDVELCVSELAANAVRHARTGFEVEVGENGGCVRISMRDGDHRPVHPRAAVPEDVTGRGLQIVAALACAWGVDQMVDGKAVWCTIAP